MTPAREPVKVRPDGTADRSPGAVPGVVSGAAQGRVEHPRTAHVAATQRQSGDDPAGQGTGAGGSGQASVARITDPSGQVCVAGASGGGGGAMTGGGGGGGAGGELKLWIRLINNECDL